MSCRQEFRKTFRQLIKTGGYCDKCTAQIRKIKVKLTNLERYGFEYPLQRGDIKDKIKQTNLERRGVEYPSQCEDVKDKIKKTNLERYGFEYPLQSGDIKDKMRSTNLERYGVENPFQSEDIKDKIRKINLDRRGVEYPFQSEDIKDKIKKTNLERYGFENAMQNPEIADRCSKTSRTYKDYTLPSGSVIKIQGYEHYALDELLQTYTEQDIVTGVTNVPRIEYTDSEGKKHYHTPDIYIRSENKIIEVKSTWTFEKKDGNVLLKQKFSKDQGYKYEIWVYNGKGTKVEIYD
jgi:hypothetical protein